MCFDLAEFFTEMAKAATARCWHCRKDASNHAKERILRTILCYYWEEMGGNVQHDDPTLKTVQRQPSTVLPGEQCCGGYRMRSVRSCGEVRDESVISTLGLCPRLVGGYKIFADNLALPGGLYER